MRCGASEERGADAVAENCEQIEPVFFLSKNFLQEN